MRETSNEVEDRADVPVSAYPKKRWLIILLLIGVVITGLALTTQPTTGGPQLLLVMLSLLFAGLYIIFSLLLVTVKWFLGSRLAVPHTRLFSLVLSFATIFLVGLNTLNQVSVTDVVLTMLFVTLLGFYVIRRF